MGSAEERSQRGAPRLEVDGYLVIEDIHGRRKVHLVDISFGGFLVSSDAPYPVGHTQDFLFATPDGQWTVPLRARAVHSYQRNASGTPEYVSGFTFVNADADSVQSRIQDVVDRVMGALSFS